MDRSIPESDHSKRKRQVDSGVKDHSTGSEMQVIQKSISAYSVLKKELKP